MWGWTCSLGLSRPGEHVPSTQPGPKWETCLLGLASLLELPFPVFKLGITIPSLCPSRTGFEGQQLHFQHSTV